jgi:hypothetical protein
MSNPLKRIFGSPANEDYVLFGISSLPVSSKRISSKKDKRGIFSL